MRRRTPPSRAPPCWTRRSTRGRPVGRAGGGGGQGRVSMQGEIIGPGSTTISPQASSGSGGASTSGSASVVTSVRVRPGEVVRGGRVLAEVSGRPVFLLQGSVPVYRD